MDKQYAYSLLTIKEFDDEKREITGIASTPTPDRMGDIVEPKGAQYKLPIPLLSQHKHDQPIGFVTHAKVTSEGIEIKAKLVKISEPGILKDRLDQAWQEIKYGLVQGLSIGFNPIEYSLIKETFSFHFMKWDWLELSSVTIPANAEASIHTVKSLDQQQRAASGTQPPAVVTKQQPTKPAGASARKPVKLNEDKTMSKTVREQIEALEASRAAKVARMQEVSKKAMDEDRSMDEEEGEEFDTLETEIKSIDRDLKRMHSMEKMAVQNAEEVTTEKGTKGPTIIVRASKDKDEDFEGQNFTRKVIARALAHLDGVMPTAVAQKRWGKTNPTLVEIIKADVAGGGSGSGEWGSELVTADNRYLGDFIEFLYAATIFDKLPLRPVPANVTIKGQDGAATGYWVGESKGITPSTADFSSVTLSPLKAAALAVVSNELLRDSSPSAEMLVRDSLVQASAQRVDTTFLSASAAVSGVSPAGMLNGVSAKTSAGDTADDLRTDIKQLYDAFLTAKNASGLWFVTQPSIAKSIQLMRNSLGQREFPDIMATGGTLEGDPVVTGDNVGYHDLILLKPSDIYKIGDRGVEVSISRDATIEMNDSPTGASDTPADMSSPRVSMFQSESTAIKIVRPLNFAKRRSHAVQYIGDGNYGAPAT